MTSKLRVWYFDTMASELVIWVREFHPTKSAALAAQRHAKREFHCFLMDADGTNAGKGAMTRPERAVLELTPGGAMRFLNTHTDPNGY